MWLGTQAGPGPQNPKVNLPCGKFSRAVALAMQLQDIELIDKTPFLNLVSRCFLRLRAVESSRKFFTSHILTAQST